MDVEKTQGRAWPAMVIFPVLFAIVTVALLAVAVIPAAGPLLGVADLLVGDTARPPRDLFADGRLEPDPDDGAIAESAVVMPNPGDRFGQISVAGTGIDAPLFWGDSPRELNAGVGTFTGGWLPGFGRTIMVTGHSNTYFSGLDGAEIGGIVTIDTHYGQYTYEITGTAVKHMDDSTAYDFTRAYENLILYTCYPLDHVGMTPERYFVYARLLSGVPVEREVDGA